MKNENGSKYDVFVSYAHQDMPFVDELVRHLKTKNRRLNVWFDHGALRLGDSFSNSVQEALEQSKYFLLVISPGYLNSPWANFEMGVALGRAGSPKHENIIPLMIGDVNRTSLPPPIARTTPILVGHDVNFDKLADDLNSIIERGEKPGQGG